MNAKDMFEKLGYVQTQEDDVLYINYMNYDTGVEVYFRPSVDGLFTNPAYEVEDDEGLSVMITVELHKAITQQLIELGWLDD